jgi:hypothetical protein
MAFCFVETLSRHGKDLVLLYLLASTALSGALAASPQPTADDAMVVNRNGITPEEFDWFMNQERVNTLEYFRTKCNFDYDKDFWTRDCEGTKPRVLLQKRTVNRIVREKVEQILFRELGLIDDVRYSAFLENLESLNRDREQAVKDGRVIYGPVRYTQLQYYGHWKASLQIQAKSKLTQERLSVAEQEVRAYYDQNKGLFKAADTTTLEIAIIEPKQVPDAEKTKGKVGSATQAILSQMRAGEGLEHVVQGYADKPDINVSCRRVDALDNERVGELFSASASAEKILALAPGECVSVADSGGTVQIIKCISKKTGDYLPLEAVKERARARCLDQLYDRLVGELTKKADVRINQQALDRILPP